MRIANSYFCPFLLVFLGAVLSAERLGVVSVEPAVHSMNTQQAKSDSDWRIVDAGALSILAPPNWKFHQLVGVDSYVGEFTGDDMSLTFDFGRYSSSLKEAKEPAYIVVHKSIANLSAKIVSPKTPGHGITGIYFPKTFGSNKLCLFGPDLTPSQQSLTLKIFETVRFGHSVPPIIPPPAKEQQ